MTKFVDVEVGKDKFSVEYSAQALMAAPLLVAQAAIEQEEMLYLLEFRKVDVMAQLGVVFRDRWGLQKPLSDFTGVRIEENPDLVDAGVVAWRFEITCPECDAVGYTTTRGGREISCPCCAETGATHNFSILTDTDGRFVGFPPTPVWCPVSTFADYDFEPLPLEDALEATGEFYK